MRRMLIDAAHAEETRVAVINGQRIEEFDFESSSRRQLRGNIYLAKVVRVEPSLQAAFVEYGGNRHGFLSFNEIHPDYYQIPIADREALLREEAEENERAAQNGHATSARDRAGDDDHEEGEEGAEGHAEEDDDDGLEEEQARRRRRLMRRYKIQEVIRRRQIMLVQVVKEERGNKGAALTSYLSLAGRYGVLMPNTARGGGISRKITSVTDRKRLKSVVNSLETPAGMGLIIRTAGAKRTKAEIKRDYEYLLRLWDNIREVTLKSVAPALIYAEEDLVKRSIRDLYDKDIDAIFVEGEEGYREAKDFMRMIMPSAAKKIQAWREPTPLFVKHRVEEQLAQIHSPVVGLKSGGYLVINQTEALVAIDVNSGRATRERNIETTALKTNLEAAEEAARQMRLRDLAGLIVIDFIDMEESKNNRAVEKRLKDVLKDDRARLAMGKISSFGLMEISRQRRRAGVLEGTTHVCPTCAGLGRVRSPESSALSTLRAIETESAKNGGGAVTVRVPNPCGLFLLNEKRGYLSRVEASHGLSVTVIIDDSLPMGEHRIERTATSDAPRPIDQAAPFVELEADEAVYDTVEEEDEDDDVVEGLQREDTDDDEESAEDGAARRSRGGRRRRRGRGRSDERAVAESAREEALEGVETAEAADAESDERGARRRRGRRGGRRSERAEGRPGDAYSWSRPRTADPSDPYVWNDPFAEQRADGSAPAAEPIADEASSASDALEAPVPGAGVDKPARPRRRRRGRGGDAPAEAADDAPVSAEPSGAEAFSAQVEDVETFEPVVLGVGDAPEAAEVEPEPANDVSGATPEPQLPDAAVAAGTTQEPAVMAQPEPVVEPEPDPNEISAPPEQPRRGWWRRRA